MTDKETEGQPEVTNDVFQTIIDGLVAQGIAYSVLEHEPVYTMDMAQEACGNEPEEGVKVLFARAYTTKKQYGYCLVVWTGNKKVDFEQIAESLGVKRVKLASPEEVQTELGIEIGALSPFGYQGSYPVVMDNALLQQQNLYINPGVHDKTIKMKPDALRASVEENASEFHVV